MRILVLANSDMGLFKFRKELLCKLISNGNEVFSILPDGPFVSQIEELGIKCFRVPMSRRGMNPIRDLRLLCTYVKIIKSLLPDYVITYTIKPNIYGGMACRMCKVPYAMNITGLGTAFQKENLLQKVVRRLYKIACKSAKCVFFENVANYNVFVEGKIICEGQGCVLNGAGVNLLEYEFEEYPTDNAQIHFLFIGRIMREKGIDELFAVAEKIKKEYKNVIFDIVGPLEEEYGEQIATLQKEKVICFHGYQEDVRNYIRQCHCFVLPSYHEGMANTVLEAGAMGRPLIVSDIPGCREAITRDGGYTCEPKNEGALYECIKTFLQLSNEQQKVMGKKTYDHIVKKFDKEKIVARTMEKMKIEIVNVG